MPTITRDEVKVPVDVSPEMRETYIDNYMKATRETGRLMLFACDQKIEHLNGDFYGEGIDPSDNDPEHLFQIGSQGVCGVLAGQRGLIAQYAPDYPEINVERDEADPDSVLNFYRKAIALRKSLPVVREGSYREFKRASDVHYFYVREDEDEKLLVMCRFADKQTLFRMPLGFELEKGELLLANYADAPGARPDGFYAFRPYECRVYRF